MRPVGVSGNGARSGFDRRPTIRRVARVQHDEARIVHRAVGEFKTAMKFARSQRRAETIGCEIERARARQQFAAAEMVIDKKPQSQQPGRPQAVVMRQDQPQRVHEMRREPQQHFSLGQRFAHQAEFVIFEIAQPAMDQLGRP